MNPDRPLDGFRSIKVKLGILVALSIVAAALVSEAGSRAGVPAWLTMPVTVAVALAVTQWLARGMTSPLREMTAAASVMATGDYSSRVTTTSRDEVGELARAFNTMAADLSAADQQRRQLVATVSHELRTPLTAQQALLENLVDGVISPDSESLRTALAQAERLSALVSDLLDLSRVEGGVTPLTISRIDLAELIDQGVREANAAGADQRHIRFDVSVDPAEVEICADAGRLAQVIANLLDNAVRHSPVGGTVTVRGGAIDTQRWALEVFDEGPGIPADRAESVFTRFGSWNDSGGGTGLGLAIASWVCELHGGSISVLPADSGAHLRAVLPTVPSPASVPEPTKENSVPHASSAAVAEPPPARSSAPTPPAASPVAQLFGNAWPERNQKARPDLVLGCVGVGVLAALILPERNNIGLGALLVLFVCGGVVFAASVRKRAPWTMALALVSAGLGSLLVLRDADWLSVLAVLIVVVLTMSALTGARAVAATVLAAASWPVAALRGLPLLGRSISALSRHSIIWPVLRTVVISVAALVIFGGLFASGDAIFGSWADRIIPDVNADGFVYRSFVGFFVGGTVLAATYVAINPPPVNNAAMVSGKPVHRRFEWLVPLGLVIAIFGVFLAAQASAMWGGHDYVQRTTGLTYAEYVHQGFGQLVAVTFLTLVTVALAARKAPRVTANDRLLLNVSLGLLCVLALAVVGSALLRMYVYQEAYGFTVLRVLVIAFEFWMGLLLMFVLAAGIVRHGRWIPRGALLSAALFVLAIGLINPEAFVAQRNIDRYNETGKIDTHYLRRLGPDATPAIVAGLPPELAACIVSAPPNLSDDVLEWNLGRARAAAAAQGLDPNQTTGCASLLSDHS
ncbi:signal transduction histidine kinase [Hoyosella altamirensis]|uniref:histidine kinase n=2 Tax=Hoyosella altamirensis TaxID=616997 RepID=A0A839RLC3_9ACTN|nr:DUF4153 domain-containing protein [Hoyosella altamirensis]MBB3036954.1 signal transduction histidine kinase [Hoyosella altamirensis]